MSRFHFEIDASATYVTTAPTMEVLVNGVVVSSIQIMQHTGSGLDYLRFELEYAGTYPSTLQFRFNDGAEGGRSIQVNDVRINGWSVDTTYITLMNLNNAQTSSVNTLGVDHLFGRTPPVVVDIGTETSTGTGGDDTIVGSNSPEIINAGNGADRVRGLNNDDAIFGGQGNDTIFGAGGNDIISGEDGDDNIYGEAGNDLLHGGLGVDLINGGDGNDLINGGDGNDTLLGGAGDDIVFGEAGNDTISGSAGNDYLYGDAGNDIVSGGAGNDTIYGGLDDDSLYGEAGDDIIYGEAGNDLIFGAAGNDTMHGNNGNDTIYGGAGNDTANGGDNNDLINGEIGNDTLNGDLGTDTIIGGAGADTINGGDGADTLLGHGLDYAAINTVLRNNPNVVYNAATGSFYQYVNTAVNFATATANAAAVSINGVAGHLAVISSATENTYVTSLINNQTWIGGTSTTGNNAQWFWSGGPEAGAQYWQGYDTGATVNNFYANWSAGQPQNNTEYWVVLYADGTWHDWPDTSTQRYVIEWESGLMSDDNAIDTINGGAGNDFIYGHGGNDILNGDADNDTIFGGLGNDSISGGTGNDALYGGDGDDTINGDAGNDLIEGGAGNDILNGGADTDTLTYINAVSGITISLALATAQVTGGAGTDTISGFENLSGSRFNDTIEGTSGNNVLDGGAGVDVLTYANATAGVTVNLATLTAQNTVGAGNDTISNFENLIGSAFNDTLTGDGNDNIIDGGAGNDTMNGAGGTDTLTYANATAGITISLALATSQVTGGSGTDTIVGFENLTGSGFDDVLGSSSANNILIGGAGTDTVSYASALAGVTVNLSLTTAQNTVGDGTDTLTGFENLTGSGFIDTLLGDGNNNTINGGAGTDTIDGGAGTDTLNGGNDADSIYGGAGTDTLNGDLGDDSLFGGAGADTLNGGDGADRLLGHSLNYADIATILAANPGTVYNQSTGNFYRYVNTAIDYSSAQAAAAAATISGVAGHLVTIGSASENTFVNALFTTNDVWLGAADSGGEGAWRWFGGSDDGGNFSSGSTAVNNYYTNWAATNPNGGTAENYAVMGTTGTWTDVAGGTTHRYVIEWEGLSFADDNAIDTLNGGIGNDILYGGGGNDILNGGDDNDRLFGDAGNDTLNGDAGNDYIVDYEGANTLSGGAGDDVVVARYLPALTVPSIEAQIDAILLANAGLEYNVDTGNFYRYVSTAAIWTAANTAAQAATINGVAGHLVVITSADENDYVDQLSLTANIFIGGTDQTLEGDWRWMGGPDNNLQFWSGGSGGSAQNGYYTNFTAGQPNAGGATEDYLGMTNGGQWTDETSATSRGYVIEWEGVSLLITPPSSPAQANNTLHGGTGNDTLYGGNGNDTINGDDDNDTLYGNDGIDTMNGGNGIDTLYGENGNDIMSGGAGVDTLYGGNDNDTINGDAGDDVLAGDTGSDTLNGGDDNDTLYASNRVLSFVATTFTATAESFTYADGGFGGTDPGNDNASGTRITTDGAATAAGALEIFLDGATNTTENNISGSWTLNFNTTVSTTDASVSFYYRINHTAGNDTGDFGDIYMSVNGTSYGVGGNAYVARVDGGSGLAVDTGWVQVTIDVGALNAGSHTLVLGGMKNTKNNANEDTTFRFDDVQIGVTADSDAGATNTLNGGNGNDILYGSDGTDTLSGGAGADTLYSGSTLPITVASVLAANPGVVYNATTDSFYRFVNTAVIWTTANTAAQAALINGVAGHLVVVTSATENAYVDTIAGTNAVWLGGTDQTVEGAWRWVGGPDNNGQFWSGTATGSAQNGYYTNWLSGQPAASAANDDYLRLRDGGLWDDRTATQTARYVIEWEASNILTATPTTNYLNGGDGLDTLYGNVGEDVFIFESISAFNNDDVISGFNRADGDALDLSDLLAGFDPLTELIADFVLISDGTQTDSYAATIRNYDSLLYYRMGETAGAVATDNMGILNGAYVNTPTLNVADFNGTLTNNAVDFNGTSQYVRVVDNAVFDLNAATFVGWFRSDTSSATQQTVFSKDGTLGGQFNIGVTTNDGDIVGMLQNGGGAAVTFDINQSVALNTWYMLSISFSTTTGVEIYLNGTSIYTNTGFTTALASNYDFILGASNTAGNTTMAQYFNGRLDDVAVFDYKLTDGAITNLYNAGINAIDGTFADGVYVSTGGTANYHNAATRIADFTGTTNTTNAMDMLVDNNIIV